MACSGIFPGVNHDGERRNQPSFPLFPERTQQGSGIQQVGEQAFEHGKDGVQDGIYDRADGCKPCLPSVHGHFRGGFVSLFYRDVAINGILYDLDFKMFEFNQKIRQFCMHDMAIVTVHPPDQIEKAAAVQFSSDTFTQVFAFHGPAAAFTDMYFFTMDKKSVGLGLDIYGIIMYNSHCRGSLNKGLAAKLKGFIEGFSFLYTITDSIQGKILPIKIFFCGQFKLAVTLNFRFEPSLCEEKSKSIKNQNVQRQNRIVSKTAFT